MQFFKNYSIRYLRRKRPKKFSKTDRKLIEKSAQNLMKISFSKTYHFAKIAIYMEICYFAKLCHFCGNAPFGRIVISAKIWLFENLLFLQKFAIFSTNTVLLNWRIHIRIYFCQEAQQVVYFSLTNLNLCPKTSVRSSSTELKIFERTCRVCGVNSSWIFCFELSKGSENAQFGVWSSFFPWRQYQPEKLLITVIKIAA